jgi:hypothetical protein
MGRQLWDRIARGPPNRGSPIRARAPRAASQLGALLFHPLQIVVAGASDAGLAAVESLRAAPHHRHLEYTNLCLLSPEGDGGGLGVESGAGDAPWVAGALAAVDAEAGEVLLADGRALPYDVLALATGLQASGGRVVGSGLTDANCWPARR